MVVAVGASVLAVDPLPGLLCWVDRHMRAVIRRYWPFVVIEIGNGKQRERVASRVRVGVLGGVAAVGLAAIGWLWS